MIIPTVHLNGTSAEDLVAQFHDAYTAIEAAQSALRQATPNGRDYYLQGDDALTQALKEHQARMDALWQIRNDMVKLCEAVDDQH